MVIVLLAFICSPTLGYKDNDPLVSTKGGLIRGLRDEMGYSKFLGVPYGQFVGNNFFGAAVLHSGFDNVFKAYDDSKICVQINSQGTAIGTTDCLNLNIYVPDVANPKNRVPVMVWIHGNTFIDGSAVAECSSPHALLRHGVVVVAINYRLGVFGFMCLDIPELPGNTGLKDQILALRWINENIDAFGGDATKITIFGKRSGGVSVNLHLFSAYEKLFHRAIIQSGPANSYWAITEADTSIPVKISTALGFLAKDKKDALNFLLQKNVYMVVKTVHKLLIANASSFSDQPLGPCIEKKFDGVENFITEYPMNIKADKANKTSIIIGYTNKEFAAIELHTDLLVEKTLAETYNFTKYLAMGFDMKYDLNEALAFAENYYIGDEKISTKVKQQLIEFRSDFIFNHPTRRMAKKLLESGAKNVYCYIFSYNGDFDLTKTWYEINHAEELIYLFDLNIEGNSLQDHLVTDEMTELWTNFAKVGDPTPANSEVTVKWTPVSNKSFPYLEIDSDLTLKNRPFFDRMTFWDMFYKLYGRYQKWYKCNGEINPDFIIQSTVKAFSCYL